MFERCLCQRVSLFLDVRMASEKNLPWKRSASGAGEVCSLHTREWGKHKNVCRLCAIPYVPHRTDVREARCAAQRCPCHLSKEAIHPQTTDTTSQNSKLLTVNGQVFWDSEVPVCTLSNSCERADAPVTPQWQPTFKHFGLSRSLYAPRAQCALTANLLWTSIHREYGFWVKQNGPFVMLRIEA